MVISKWMPEKRMLGMLFLVTMLSLQQRVATMRTVIVKNQSSILVMEGMIVRLSCITDKQWFFCLWNSPSQEQSCAIQYQQPTSVCSHRNRTTIIGETKACDLQIQVYFASIIYLCVSLSISSILIDFSELKILE